MQSTLQTGLVLVVILLGILGFATTNHTMTAPITTATARACRDVLASTAAHVSAAIVQAPNAVTKFQSMTPVTKTINVSVYNYGTTTTDAVSVTARPQGSNMNFSASMPDGTTCSESMTLSALTLTNGTTSASNPNQPKE